MYTKLARWGCGEGCEISLHTLPNITESSRGKWCGGEGAQPGVSVVLVVLIPVKESSDFQREYNREEPKARASGARSHASEHS